MEVKVLLGDEAIAQGALDAGVSGCYAYPGTPSTEILEYIQASPEARRRGVHRDWSSNEKTAMEAALGMSYAGKRALVSMKHVGLNVAADGFINAAITGTGGGLVAAVADDPSMHSSQNEQDSRYYAHFARIPCLEPSSQQEAYDMVRQAMALSEEERLPVLLRLTTRLAHSRANVTCAAPMQENECRLPDDPRRFILLPVIARGNFSALLDKQGGLVQHSENSGLNRYIDAEDRSLGIIAAGLGWNYLQENYRSAPCPHPVLKVSQYPLPKALLRRLRNECDRILVLEEGYPFIEEQLRGALDNAGAVAGRMSGDVPRQGELTPDHVARALNLDTAPPVETSDLLTPRPPRLCAGCPHIHSYQALVDVIKPYGPGHVFSDIGCYTLGALPPFEAISTCVDMGASITMAKGAVDAGFTPGIAVLGDSTFTHSGMTGLLDAVWEQTAITVVILDNGTTGMTGGQDSLATGRLEELVTGIGVEPEHVRTVEPLPANYEQNVNVLHEEIEYQGVSVVIAHRECIQTLRRTHSSE